MSCELQPSSNIISENSSQGFLFPKGNHTTISQHVLESGTRQRHSQKWQKTQDARQETLAPHNAAPESFCKLKLTSTKTQWHWMTRVELFQTLQVGKCLTTTAPSPSAEGAIAHECWNSSKCPRLALHHQHLGSWRMDTKQFERWVSPEIENDLDLDIVVIHNESSGIVAICWYGIPIRISGDSCRTKVVLLQTFEQHQEHLDRVFMENINSYKFHRNLMEYVQEETIRCCPRNCGNSHSHSLRTCDWWHLDLRLKVQNSCVPWEAIPSHSMSMFDEIQWEWY